MWQLPLGDPETTSDVPDDKIDKNIDSYIEMHEHVH